MNRKQYVYIDGMESEVIDSGNCSVCQGSKLSSLLYILYTNEIPLLDKIINTELHNRLNDKDIMTDTTDIDQYTVQYVDDSTTMITTNDITNLKTYIDNFFHILEQYYYINKLTLNQDKTKFMIVCKAAKRETRRDGRKCYNGNEIRIHRDGHRYGGRS